MKKIDLQFLIQEQEERIRRRDALLEQYRPFQEAFVNRWMEFSKSATGSELMGVKECKQVSQGKDFAELTCTFNGLDIIIVVSTHVLPLDSFSDMMITKILIYTDDAENAEPYIQVIFHETATGSYGYYITWLPDGEALRLKDRGQGTAEGGQEAAEIILGHIYSLRRHWRERPSLRAVRNGKSSVRSIGFVPKKNPNKDIGKEDGKED